VKVVTIPAKETALRRSTQVWRVDDVSYLCVEDKTNFEDATDILLRDKD
jgi:hypothetical protein